MASLKLCPLFADTYSIRSLSVIPHQNVVKQISSHLLIAVKWDCGFGAGLTVR
jgi:hypothetical protein